MCVYVGGGLARCHLGGLSPTPLPGHPRPPEALGTREQPWAWGEASHARERGARAAAQRTEAEAEEAAPSPGEAWKAGFSRWGARLEEVHARGQTFLAFDLGHPCPQPEPAGPAHPLSSLARGRRCCCCGRGSWGAGPGHQGSGEPPGLVTASAAFLARLEGVGSGER